MKLLFGTLLATFASGVVADGLVPLTVMRPTCIRQGKCVNDKGQVDPAVCCSGVCDKDNGCVSTTEASSILMRTTLAGAPFICKTDSFFGVRCGDPSFFHSGKISPDCLCPEGKPCLIGNGDTPLCSSRFWVGHCDPDNSACVPQLQISVALEKTLFDSPTPTLNNGLGGECATTADCIDTNLVCTTTCMASVADPVASNGCPTYGFEVATAAARDLGDSDVCTQTAGSVALNEPCLCEADCTDANAVCMLLQANSLDGLAGPLDDMSFLGKCLIPPGDTGCALDCDCPPGSVCDPSVGGGTCTIPAGSTVTCDASNPCTPPASCNSGVCELPAGEDCVDDVQCVGTCDASGVCV
ncbi:MAG: hypothetical protein MHM6MM_001609 [Cercozoa sp. M6MM]